MAAAHSIRFACVLAAGVALCLSAGACQLLQPNYLCLVSEERTEHQHDLLRFTHGMAYAPSEGTPGFVLLAGQDAVLLFDYDGPTNRVQLLFCPGADRALYERIGQRDRAFETPAGTAQVGVRVRHTPDHLRGSIDVFLARSEREGLPVCAAFERHPRSTRLVGYFAVPVHEQPLTQQDPASELSHSPLQTRLLVDRLARILGAGEPVLPRLPALDVEYLVPTTMLARLVGAP